MTLAAGTRLGLFEVLGPLGAGGMGEVYRARDTRLDREVAVKVLPQELAAMPGRLRRFEDEARGASSLNHPAIVTIFEIGEENGTPYIVMELVSGKTLREHLESGPLPWKRLLDVAASASAGLAAAHEAGIVHRDLKPENLMVTREGGVKILDFGLAKLARKALDQGEKQEATLAPTTPGELLGTVGYMSPEQASGQRADFRSDQFSLGSMLYEMAAGRKAFHGTTAVDTLAAILHAEPQALPELRPELPAPFAWIVERCLAKDPEGRYHSTADLARDLAMLRDRAASGAGSIAPPRRKEGRWRAVTFAAVALALAATATLIGVILERKSAAPAHPARFSFALPNGVRMANLIRAVSRHDLAVSPDGERIAFAALRDGVSRLWVRPLDSLSVQEIPGTEEAASPFWSPDGASLAFFADGKLKRVAVSGGGGGGTPPRTLAQVTNAHVFGTWSYDGTILVAQGPLWTGRGLYTIGPAGGELRKVSAGEAWSRWDGFSWPRFLPDGRRFLVHARSEDDGYHLLAGATDGSAPRDLGLFDSRFELGAGRLFFVRDGTLYAQPFDAANLSFGGEAVAVVPEIPYFISPGWAPFSVSRDGVLVYQAGRVATALTWLDRAGRTLGSVGAPAYYGSLRLSPDGRSAAVERLIPASGFSDLWIEDFGRAIETRLTSGEANESLPAWSPDGRAIGYWGTGETFIKSVGEVGDGRIAVQPDCDFAQLADWSPDGRLLLFSATCVGSRADLWLVPADGNGAPTVFRRTEFSEGEGGAAFSPDGGWIAYLSDESGRFELYLSPLGGTGKIRVSSAGAALQPPRFRRDGKEIYYVDADHRLLAVPLSRRGDALEPGIPATLFALETESWNSYDVTADGQRFLVNPGTRWDTSPITVVLDAAR